MLEKFGPQKLGSLATIPTIQYERVKSQKCFSISHIVHVTAIGLRERWEVLLGPDRIHPLLDRFLALDHVWRDYLYALVLHERPTLYRHIVSAQRRPDHGSPQSIAIMDGNHSGVGGPGIYYQRSSTAIGKPDWLGTSS